MDTTNLQEPGQPAENVCFDQELISRYGGRGPRYTSYPTALQFDESFTAEQYTQATSTQLSTSTYSSPNLGGLFAEFCAQICKHCSHVSLHERWIATFGRHSHE